MAGFYARFQCGEDSNVCTFGIPSHYDDGGVARLLNTADAAADFAARRCSKDELTMLEVMNEDGTLAKKVL